ncbi:hypothetical protein E3N88_07266 [Mikania micrantha]|uniref:Uncharacterized protein n=1 Tax=Mikania micrantha TaxID=192012 RepID=A0A5N6PTF6_9ASTR|nr:hypothetical protein E3N88_07266 [Mikania micrantha]
MVPMIMNQDRKGSSHPNEVLADRTRLGPKELGPKILHGSTTTLLRSEPPPPQILHHVRRRPEKLGNEFEKETIVKVGSAFEREVRPFRSSTDRPPCEKEVRRGARRQWRSARRWSRSPVEVAVGGGARWSTQPVVEQRGSRPPVVDQATVGGAPVVDQAAVGGAPVVDQAVVGGRVF